MLFYKPRLQRFYVAKKMQENAAFYGLGEQTGHLNKKGYHYLNWNTDNPAPHNETFDRDSNLNLSEVSNITDRDSSKNIKKQIML